MPIRKVCEVCEIEFSVPPNRESKARFCSQKCRIDSGYQEKRTAVIKGCLHCGVSFETKEAWLRKGAGKYCSRACKDESQKNKSVPTEKLTEAYVNGISCMQIGEKFGLSSMVVWRRLQESGVDMRTAEEGIVLAYKELKGPKNKNWKGGRFLKKSKVREQEYWLIYKPEYPQSRKSGYILEHIYVWEQANGRPVQKGWHVHHKNLISTDNRPLNLEELSPSAHTKLHNDLRIKELRDAKRRIKQLEAEVERLKANKKGDLSCKS